jgi:putative transposase
VLSGDGMHVRTTLVATVLYIAKSVQLDFIRLGKPTENGRIESFNGRFRDECLDVHTFLSMDDVRGKLEAWRHDYRHHRPDGSLGHLTFRVFILTRALQE